MSPNTRLTNRLAWAAIAAACLAASCTAPDAAGWKVFAPEGAGFSVAMPGVPTRDQKYARNESGTIETNIYTLLLPEGGVYTVVDSILPPSTDVKAGADSVLDAACERQVVSANGRMVSKQTIFLGGNSGRQVEAEVPESAVPGGAVLKARVYLVGTRLYEVVAVVPKPAASSPATTRYLDSFELKEPQR